MLSKESELAMEQRRNLAKRLGEEAEQNYYTDDADALHDRGTYHCSGVDKVLEKFTEVKEVSMKKGLKDLFLEEMELVR